MTAHTVGTSRLAARGAFASEAWNALLSVLEGLAFGGGAWLALDLLRIYLEEPPLVAALGPAAPAIAGSLFLVGRLWVGIGRRGVEAPRIPEAMLAGILLALLCRGAAWGFEFLIAYVPISETVAAGVLRGAWQAAALAVPYLVSSDHRIGRHARSGRAASED